MDTETDYVILDARTQAEFDEGHISGAVCISHEEIAQKAEEILTQLQIMSEQAKYPENREIFAEFLRELQNL